MQSKFKEMNKNKDYLQVFNRYNDFDISNFPKLNNKMNQIFQILKSDLGSLKKNEKIFDLYC